MKKVITLALLIAMPTLAYTGCNGATQPRLSLGFVMVFIVAVTAYREFNYKPTKTTPYVTLK